MHSYGAADKRTGYRLSRVEVERQGRWVSFARTVAVAAALWVVQFPAWMAAQGHWSTVYPVDAVVPARISLVIDVGMIMAYVLVAYRAVELMWSSRGPRAFRYLSYLGMAMVVLGAALDVVEDVLLWTRVEGAVGPVDMRVGFTPVMWTLVGVGLVLVFLVAVLGSPGFWWRREGATATPRFDWPSGRTRDLLLAVMRRTGDDDTNRVIRRWRSVLEDHAPYENGHRRAGTVICCSGGGIRSASFCLGGLQVLTDRGRYQESDAVIGVSGGGYIAAAYHTARWRSSTETEDLWPELTDPPVYAPASPELQWLRRHTRYLFDSLRVATTGLLSLLFGIAVNLVLLTALLGGLAWWLGWLLQASGGITGLLTPHAVAGAYDGGWAWLGQVWWLPVAGVGVFVVEKVLERFVTLPFQATNALRTSSFYLLWGGLAVTGLLLGLPHAMAWLHDYAATSSSAYAQLISATGLIPYEVCQGLLASGQDACGHTAAGSAAPPASATSVSAVSLASVIAAVLAVVKAAQESLGGGGASGTGRGAWLGRLWSRVKDHLVPWIALVVIALLCLAMTLRWTVAFLTQPELLSNWGLAYAFGLGLVAIKLGTDANRTSLHHFYRERLSYAFLVRREGDRIMPVGYGIPLRFSQSTPPRGRGPRLVSCAVANVRDLDLVPADRHCTPFVFDDRQIGLTDHLLPAGANLTASSLYEFAADVHYRDATIPAAMAMSGAAFSPLVGRQNGRVGPYRAVLALANARLGVWLPNPLWVDDIGTMRRLVQLRRKDEVLAGWERLTNPDARMLFEEYLSRADKAWLCALAAEHRARLRPGEPVLRHTDQTWFRFEGASVVVRDRARLAGVVEGCRNLVNKPGAFRLAKEAFGRTSVLDRRLYITDGGHYDNLGLVEALRRRASEIYVLDASSDPEDSFRALGEAIATARIDLGCEVEFNPRKMRRLGEGKRATMAWGSGTARYADGSTAVIHLAKVILVDEELPWDLESYAGANPQFPRTSTGNQLYGEFDLEAYRILGREVTKRLLAPPPASSPVPAPPSTPAEVGAGVSFPSQARSTESGSAPVEAPPV